MICLKFDGINVILFQQKNGLLSLKQCAISLALAVGLVTGVPALGCPGHANAGNSAVEEKFAGQENKLHCRQISKTIKS